ncbi:MAG TPA: class I SAM-dependent methyltransferase, partial [Polyangiales bacterium]|nr:class I SAM-dependent methyltransferase [Polyangiales bacterium]
RLTRDLALSPGLRCADIACGTGVDTLDLLSLTAPSEVVAVDCSPAMLDEAKRRADAAGFDLATRCEEAEDFIAVSEPASFDVITLRFCLGYLEWRDALARLPRLLRRAGRIGLITSLSSSAPQAYAIYQELGAELGVPAIPISAPTSIDEIDRALRTGDALPMKIWTHALRLRFGSGEEMARWLQVSGIATHPALDALPRELAQHLWQRFADRVERYRIGSSVPLDFDVAGIVATKHA